jgi:hypothetical protein
MEVFFQRNLVEVRKSLTASFCEADLVKGSPSFKGSVVEDSFGPLIERIKKPPDKLAGGVECSPFPGDDLDDAPLEPARIKKPPDKEAVLSVKAFSILDDCVVSRDDALIENCYPCSKLPMNGVDGVRLKKKRRRKKGKGLLSRKNFVYNRGRNSWTLIGDYHAPPVVRPELAPPRKKRKKKEGDALVNCTDSAVVKRALVNRVILNSYCSGFREDPDFCELDRTKSFNFTPGRAKKVYFSVTDAVDSFARVSDAWDCFEEELIKRLYSARASSPPSGHVSVSLPSDRASNSLVPLRVGSLSSIVIPGRGRAIGV